MKKAIKKIFSVSSIALTGMYLANKYIDTCTPPIVPSKNNKIYQWRNMDIHYTEKGDQDTPPLLLIHNLYPSSSKEEWYCIDDGLAKKYHIYELDLPGCGKSDKSNITYINYMYVQLLISFIKEVIKNKTNICVTAFSSSFTFMAARMDPEIVNKIIVINPTSIDALVRPVTKINGFQKSLIGSPVIGTFLYNCKMSKAAILDDYKYIYFYNHKNVPVKAVDISYYNAHYGHSKGKYLFSSMIGNYTNINIIHALPKIKNEIYLIGSGNHKAIIQEYKKHNQKIHVSYVSNCRLLPQLEIPKTIIEKIDQALNDPIIYTRVR